MPLTWNIIAPLYSTGLASRQLKGLLHSKLPSAGEGIVDYIINTRDTSQTVATRVYKRLVPSELFAFASVSRERLPHWVEGYLLNAPEYAVGYAALHGFRWGQLESALLEGDPKDIPPYVNLVLKAPWPEAEPVIRKDPTAWLDYCAIFS